MLMNKDYHNAFGSHGQSQPTACSVTVTSYKTVPARAPVNTELIDIVSVSKSTSHVPTFTVTNPVSAIYLTFDPLTDCRPVCRCI